MRNLKFILSTAAILLVGTVAVGLAAHAVVSPPTGEVRSAGVVTIPSALGQTAEEVLFYPWSMYDTETLYPIPDDYLLYHFGLAAYGDTVELARDKLLDAAPFIKDGSFFSLFSNFGLFQHVQIPWADLISSLEWNYPPQGLPHANGHMFLKDLPAMLPDGAQGTGTPVTLSFALSDNDPISVSFLIRPAQPRTLTAEEQAAALERVELELRRFFLVYDPSISEQFPDWQTNGDWQGYDFMASDGLVEYDPETGSVITELYRLLKTFFDYNYGNDHASPAFGESLLPLNDLLNCRFIFAEAAGVTAGDSYQMPMDEFLSEIETYSGCNVQIITTQQQIVVLFTYINNVYGVYYDIQLGCYSGIGISSQ